MKKLLPIAIACLFALSTQAQSTPASSPSSTTKATPAQSAPATTPSSTTKAAPAQVAPASERKAPETAASKASRDGVMMRDGKMWVIKDGKSTAMTAEMTMSNGTKVMTDGTYMTKDGKKMKMKNGESMRMDGELMKAETPAKAPEPKAAPAK